MVFNGINLYLTRLYRTLLTFWISYYVFHIITTSILISYELIDPIRQSFLALVKVKYINQQQPTLILHYYDSILYIQYIFIILIFCFIFLSIYIDSPFRDEGRNQGPTRKYKQTNLLSSILNVFNHIMSTMVLLVLDIFCFFFFAFPYAVHNNNNNN